LKHSLELVAAFWGVLYLGAVPSILPYLTEKMDPASYAERIRLLIGHSGAKAVMTFASFQEQLQSALKGVDCEFLSLEDVSLKQDLAPEWLIYPSSPEQTAVLLFSSGTTGIQKGVAISHRSFLEHHQSLAEAIGLHPDDVIVSWLPLYHDLGLIGSLLLPVIAGVSSVIMSSFYWVRNPAVLLKVIHRYRATVCWMPNFGFNHTARSVRQRDLEDLDLSSIRFLMNSAEPVRYDSIERFLEVFEQFGFNREAIGTGYGMVENGGVTISPPGKMVDIAWVDLKDLQEHNLATKAAPDEAGATPIVSCGVPMCGVEVKIVDEEGAELPERHVGEVAVRSGFLFKEYHNRPELTQEVMRAGWFLSGDLGFMADGQLFITGRKKDLIITAGKSIYPEDVEEIANNVAGVYPGRAAAFGLEDPSLGSERIALVYEMRGEPQEEQRLEVERALRRRVLEELDVTLSEVRLVERGWIVKSPSGKIARSDNREKYLHLRGQLAGYAPEDE
jgi:fatty-acyl-CoA synthase